MGEERFSHIHLQRGDEGFLRDVDLAELAHLLLAFLLLLQKLAFARDVAAVAFRGDVLGQKARTVSRAMAPILRRLSEKRGRKVRPSIEHFDADDPTFGIVIKYDVGRDFSTLNDLFLR